MKKIGGARPGAGRKAEAGAKKTIGTRVRPAIKEAYLAYKKLNKNFSISLEIEKFLAVLFGLDEIKHAPEFLEANSGERKFIIHVPTATIAEVRKNKSFIIHRSSALDAALILEKWTMKN